MRNFLLLIFFIPIVSFAQTDSLIFKNQDVIVGEIKSMNRGVIQIETDYSDSDFKIKWDELIYIKSDTRYLFSLRDGTRLNGKISTIEDGTFLIRYVDPAALIRIKKGEREEDQQVQEQIVTSSEIVYMNALDDGFWSRLSASIDLGWSLTKANNLRQFNIRSGLGYLADRWKINSSFNNIRSNQDEVEPTKRTDANISFVYFLPKDWFLLYDFTYLSNTEQLIRARVGNKVGFGKYLVHTNKSYLGFQVGANLNNETYFDDTPGRRTGEAFFGSELNLYDIGDLTLLSSVFAYPNLTDKGRFRTDFRLDVKYEFLEDFYVNLGTTINYDNRPISGASSLDYIFQTTIGWSL
ncbi:DUF481 domain-containing protein [Algoriphagus kandeliae]|uniref:DUF481 domain-containing protein n=1 Tax=Algoriphagus kandeliae TaxID=2562278 RepID=A0A4Y9QM38_9BACT|nr:DUF481 domain-containing protein [Algoriphagus kandeliae]TFV92026.1 DUF481 domain-containing protein [Algoriphagus kandeliae]